MKKNLLSQLFSSTNIQPIIETNQTLQNFGLQISQQDAYEIKLAEQQSLLQTNRITLGDQLIPQIVDNFKSSHYLTQQNLKQMLEELTHSFYELKNICGRNIEDEELICAMFFVFDHLAGGDVLMMQDIIIERIPDNFDADRSFSLIFEDPENEYKYMEVGYEFKPYGD